MPDLRFTVCPRCKRLKPQLGGLRYCSECEAEVKRERAERRDYRREYEKRQAKEDPKYRRFYKSREWRMTSRQYAVDHGHRCEECGAVGTDVHHVQPIQTEEGWRRRFDQSNLRLLCVKRHNKAHGREFGQFHA